MRVIEKEEKIRNVGQRAVTIQVSSYPMAPGIICVCADDATWASLARKRCTTW